MPRPVARCYCCKKATKYGLWRKSRFGKYYDPGNGISTCIPGIYLCNNCESMFQRSHRKRIPEKTYHVLPQDERTRLGDELVAWFSSALSSLQSKNDNNRVFLFITDNWRLTIDWHGSLAFGSREKREEELICLVKSISWETTIGHRKQIKSILDCSSQQKTPRFHGACGE